jgi:hypothetical protein
MNGDRPGTAHQVGWGFIAGYAAAPSGDDERDSGRERDDARAGRATEDADDEPGPPHPEPRRRPVASVCGTFLVRMFSGNLVAMFMAPCLLAGAVILVFAARLADRHLSPIDKSRWSWGEFGRTFYGSPRANPDFAWAFASRFLFVTADAFLTRYTVLFLLDRVGASKDDVPQLVFSATVVHSVLVVAASLAGGRLSDRTGRRKVFVCVAAVVFGTAMFSSRLRAASTVS